MTKVKDIRDKHSISKESLSELIEELKGLRFRGCIGDKKEYYLDDIIVSNQSYSVESKTTEYLFSFRIKGWDYFDETYESNIGVFLTDNLNENKRILMDCLQDIVYFNKL